MKARACPSRAGCTYQRLPIQCGSRSLLAPAQLRLANESLLPRVREVVFAQFQNGTYILRQK
eukprot:1507311-Amphidinium_carterae.1